MLQCIYNICFSIIHLSLDTENLYTNPHHEFKTIIVTEAPLSLVLLLLLILVISITPKIAKVYWPS
jgi:uncharacterized protein YqhQ